MVAAHRRLVDLGLPPAFNETPFPVALLDDLVALNLAEIV